MNIPIGDRIWKREETRDDQAALMIAVTLRHGDHLQRQFEPFIAATKQWWRASHAAKERDFLITVADEASRPDEIRALLGQMILNDRDLRVIFSAFRSATLMFDAPDGARPGESSLKTPSPHGDSYLPAWTSHKWLPHMPAFLASARALWAAAKPKKLALGFHTPLDADTKYDQATPADAKKALLLEGTVTWAYIARAFFPAYVPGVNTHYGSVVYATEEHEPDSIFELAWAVNQLRQNGAPTPKGTEQVARAIRDDRSTFARIHLPVEVGAHGDSWFANLCIHRTRLPGGYLHDRLLPLLIAPKSTEWCCILPLRAWPPELQSLWLEGPPARPPEAFTGLFERYKVKP